MSPTAIEVDVNGSTFPRVNGVSTPNYPCTSPLTARITRLGPTLAEQWTTPTLVAPTTGGVRLLDPGIDYRESPLSLDLAGPTGKHPGVLRLHPSRQQFGDPRDLATTIQTGADQGGVPGHSRCLRQLAAALRCTARHDGAQTGRGGIGAGLGAGNQRRRPRAERGERVLDGRSERPALGGQARRGDAQLAAGDRGRPANRPGGRHHPADHPAVDAAASRPSSTRRLPGRSTSRCTTTRAACPRSPPPSSTVRNPAGCATL